MPSCSAVTFTGTAAGAAASVSDIMSSSLRLMQVPLVVQHSVVEVDCWCATATAAAAGSAAGVATAAAGAAVVVCWT